MELKSNDSFLVWISSWGPCDPSWELLCCQGIVYHLCCLLWHWPLFYPTLYHLLPYSLLRHWSATVNFLLSSMTVFKIAPNLNKLNPAPGSQAQATQGSQCFRIPSLKISKRSSNSWDWLLKPAVSFGRAIPGPDQGQIFFLLFSLCSKTLSPSFPWWWYVVRRGTVKVKRDHILEV